MSRCFLSAGVMLAALALPTSDARACSCTDSGPQRDVVPRNGAMEVPTDAALRIFLRGFSESERAAITAEYRLRDSAGALVPLDVRMVLTRIDLVPRAPLQPGVEHTLEQVFAYGAAGTRVGDRERRYARPGALRGAWFPVATFRTAAGPASRASRAPAITRASLRFAQGGGDCGPGASLAVEVQLPADTAPTDVLELRVRGQGVVATAPAANASTLYAGDLLCNPDPITLRRGATLAVQLVARSASGTELGASGWTRATGAGPRPRAGRHGEGRSHRPWASLTMITPALTAPTGPASCPWGLEVTSRREAVSEGAPRSYAQRSTLVGDGAATWLAFSGTESSPTMRLFSIDAQGARSPASAVTTTGRPEALTIGASGPLLVARAPGAAEHSELVSLDRRGARAWSSALPAEAGRHGVASGGGRVLAVWGARAQDRSESLTYALFDARSGAPMASAVTTSHGLHTDAHGAAAAFVDGRFLVVWPSGEGWRTRGPLRAAAITATTLGAPGDLAIDTYGPFDLVAAGRGAGLVTATREGRISWALLDREGRIPGSPVSVGEGIAGRARLPRIAWDGRTFAVAWETHPDPGAYVAVVDASGAVSPALRIDAGEPDAGTVGIAPRRGGWIASYTAARARGMLVTLRCRAERAPEAPQSIDPVR